MDENETIELIKETIEKVRPFMQRDGGDVTFHSFEDGIVYVNIEGACSDCAYITDDIEFGIETIIMEEVPGVIAVRPADQKEEIKKALKEADSANF